MKKKPFLLSLALVCFLCTGTFSALLCFLQGLRFTVISPALWGAGAGLALGCLYFFVARLRRPLLVAGGLAYGAAFVVLFPKIQTGARYCGQLVRARFAEVFSEYGAASLPLPSLSALNAAGIFLFFAAILPALYLCWAVLRRQSFWLFFAGTLPLFGFAFNLFGLPGEIPSALLIGCWLALLLKGPVAKMGQKTALVRAAGAFLLALVYFFCAFLLFPRAQYTVWEGVFKARSSLADFGTTLQYASPFDTLPGFYSGTPLGNRQVLVDLSSTGYLRFGSDTALRIQGSLAPGAYLRGFSSAVYTGQAWQQLPEQEYPEQGFAFEPLTYYSSAVNNAPGANEFFSAAPLSVINKSANPQYCYAPYGFALPAKESGGFAFVQDAYFFPKEQLYSLEFLNPLAGPMPPATLDDYLNLSSSGSYALVLGQNPENGRQVLVFTGSDGTQSIYEFNPVHSFFIETPVQLDLAQIPYTGADREYMEYIREVYTRLPEDTAAAMRQIAAEEGIAASEGIWDWQYLAVRVAKYVQTAARYTQTPGRQPANQDFAAYFLTTGKKGYCMHFATAAVTLLRA
ncbi:MAG: transglutaminase-like domain-containing protein, partial [Oscillospiraceae bacterium]